MPRRRKAQFATQGRIVTVPFRIVVSESSLTAGGFQSSYIDLLASNLGGRAAAIADNFEFFRLKKVRAYSVSGVGGGFVAFGATPIVVSPFGITHGICFVRAGAQDIATSSMNSLTRVAQTDCFAMNNGYNKASIVVPSSLLKHREYKWYRTTTTNSPPYDETTQGSIFLFIQTDLGFTSAVKQYGVLEGEVEFCGQMDPAETVDYPIAVLHPCVVADEKSDDYDNVSIGQLVPPRSGLSPDCHQVESSSVAVTRSGSKLDRRSSFVSKR